jgi:Eco57I restriction-modification methylase
VLAGFGGHLVSEYYLETELSAATSDAPRPSADVIRRQLVQWRESCAWLGPASSVQTLVESAAMPLVGAMGFEPVSHVTITREGTVATIRAATQPVVLAVTSWGGKLDRLWRSAVTESIRRHASWAILFNGTQVRIIDAWRPCARRFVEFDVDLALDDERTFAAFWTLLHASAFHTPVDGRPTRLHSLVERSDQHASGVSRSLRDGVLAASADVLGALLPHVTRTRIPPPLDAAFEQALTIVYRMLFLLFAEARGLVPIWHPVYRESYSLESLRSAAEGPSTVTGLWEALRAIARLAHAGCRAGDLRVTPFNGRLFAPQRTQLAERRGLDDEAARRAVLALSTRPAPGREGRERIAYRDLGVEQLGAVYETLLDYEPRLAPAPPAAPRPRRAVTLVCGSGVRKATGSFYTPQPIADYLVRRTLAPLVRDTTPEQILRLRVVDPAVGSGAFLVAACRYLADAYEAALIRSGGCGPTDFGEPQRVATRRTIAERCLFGVDVNPMAVQLARLSLWLATLAADRPLTFLDHHLQTGDSLAGAWLASLRRPPGVRPARRRTDDATLPLFDETAVADALKSALPIRFRLAEEAGDTIDRVRAKERALTALNRRDTLLSKWKRVADVWCAPWFGEPDAAVPAEAFTALSDAILNHGGPLPPKTADQLESAAASVAESRQLFHWELEFPEVFFAADGSRRPDGGFDAVIGNPPWDMIRADAGSAERRAHSRPRGAAFVRFTRDSGIYTAQSDGHANRYQLFLERSIALLTSGGRLGMVLPSGLISDHGSAALRRQLLNRCDIDALVGFDNQHAVFPIHRSMRFVLVTASRGSPTRMMACRLGEHDPASLDAIGDEPAASSSWFPVRLTPALLERVSGADLAIPDVRAPVDLSIIERAATLFPPLGGDEGWRARFGRELNITEDRESFGPPRTGLPVIEGKQIRPFSVDLGAARFSIDSNTARRLLEPARYQRSRLAYRDVASATNRLTLIAAILPKGCVSTHTVFCLRSPFARQEQDFLCGLFNSFVLNYMVRLRITSHVTTAVVERLPIPGRHHRPRSFREIAALARLLARRHDDRAFATLQALVAGLYQLSVTEFEHVLGTFPLIPKETREGALTRYREMCG